MAEMLILVGNPGAGWTPTIPDFIGPPDDRVLERTRQLRIEGMEFRLAYEQAKREIKGDDQ